MYRIGEAEIEEIIRLMATKKLFRDGSDLQEIRTFEREWAEKIGTRYAVCVTGGTPAIICGLAGLGIGPGDEVIVPGYTFMATATAVLAVGAIPVIAEIDQGLTIDAEDLERKISPDTRAVIPVHMRGFPCDMRRITDVARKAGLKIVEDACQADGGSFRGKRLGAWGDVGAFSFNFYKIITCGEGGAVTTDDRVTHERILMYHDGGSVFRTYAGELESPYFLGVQYRCSEILGAVLRMQLGRLEDILADLRKRKRMLTERLEGKAGIRLVPSHDPEGDCGTHVGLVFEGEEQARRFLEASGIRARVVMDSGKHIYKNWDPILEKRVGHHAAMNPFHMPANRGLRQSYSPDMCPRTLDIVSRTVLIKVDPDWSEEAVDALAARCVDAAGKL
jgi:dTDP-4-amino-4,6-dideoxygalactose transaminase